MVHALFGRVYVNLEILKALVCHVHGQYSSSFSVLHTHFRVSGYLIGNIRFWNRGEGSFVCAPKKQTSSKAPFTSSSYFSLIFYLAL